VIHASKGDDDRRYSIGGPYLIGTALDPLVEDGDQQLALAEAETSEGS
jgi:hypothetical protein